MDASKNTPCPSLAPIVVEILLGLGFSPKRLQRRAGLCFLKKPHLSAPKPTDSVTYFHKKIPKTIIGIRDFVYLKWNGLQLKCFFRIVIAKQLHWIF